MLKEWYFCLNGNTINRPDHDWKNMIRVAVKSAKKNTKLHPNFIYDGEDSDFIQELKDMGVNVIYHKSVLYNDIKKTFDDTPMLDVACGAFLRLDIPLFCNDPFYIYTDCDVIFQNDIDDNPNVLSEIKFFTAAPQFSKTDYENDLNSGVLICNNIGMTQSYRSVLDFSRNHLNNGGFDTDQFVIRNFYKGKYNHLNIDYNWKPYWGVNDKASIIHFHGPKPLSIKERLNSDVPYKNEDWEKLYQTNTESYKHYVKLFEGYLNS